MLGWQFPAGRRGCLERAMGPSVVGTGKGSPASGALIAQSRLLDARPSHTGPRAL